MPSVFMDHAIKSECFALWVYGDLTEEKRKIWLLTILSGKIVAARGRGLSDADEEKLVLAGRGDIKRFFDKVEMMRSGFEEARKDISDGQDFLHRLTPLSQEFQFGPFRDHSLFAKTLRKIEREKAEAR